MQPQATPSAEAAPATWRTFGRHQVGAAVATLIDFASMIFLVETLGFSPTAGTAISASLGAVANFSLGRVWIFRRHSGHWAAQAVRYAFVSATSAGLNALGEQLVQGRAHVQYVLARVLVSVVVSLAWNFPMQHRFVFRESNAS